MVDIFRASEAAGAIVEEALRMTPLPKVIWMQLTVRNDARRGCGGSQGPDRRHEPLPQDRIRPLVGRDQLAGRQQPRHLRQEAVMALKGVQKLRLGP